jgi:hypothetical protein
MAALHLLRSRRGAALLLAGLLVLVAVVVAVRLRPQQHCDDLPGPAVSGPRFGLTTPGLPDDFTAVEQVRSAVGAPPRIVMWYASWQAGGDFPAEAARRSAAAGAVPQVTWEPWDPAAGPEQQTFPLTAIADGRFDEYVGRWAEQVEQYAGPVMLRFAHEMNTPTYPWGEVEGRNPDGSYVAAWRHVHEVFSEAGATNVTWVWSPNVPYSGTTDLAVLYPGDDFVDAVALDGYNWSTVHPDTGWQSFAEVFGPGLDQLDDLTDRPRLIGEVASAEVGGDKGAKETDWRISSSPGSLEAFREGLAARG